TRQMTVADAINAIKEQNVQVAPGRLGQPPLPPGTHVPYQLVLNTQGRLDTVEKFLEIRVKSGPQGQLVHMRDIVRDTVLVINLDPAKLKAKGIKPDDVFNALKLTFRRV